MSWWALKYIFAQQLTRIFEVLVCQRASSRLKVMGWWWPPGLYCHLLGLGVLSISISISHTPFPCPIPNPVPIPNPQSQSLNKMKRKFMYVECRCQCLFKIDFVRKSRCIDGWWTEILIKVWQYSQAVREPGRWILVNIKWFDL